VVSLLRDRRYAPLPVLPGGEAPAALDLVLVIDGTTRVYENPEAKGQSGSSAGSNGEEPSTAPAGLRPLLGREEAWREHVDALVGLAEALAAEVDSLRVGFLAFGDHEVKTLRAPGLRPSYHLYPEPGGAVRFRSFDADALREGLLGIPPCSGGDFVDALADALDRCVELRWHEDAQRVVLVTGDSPGYSILRPAPRGADLQAREKDVETLALALHRAGVQTATVYHRPPPEGGFETLGHAKALIGHAADQYRRIASRADLAFEASSFEPEVVAGRILSPPPLMGRGPSYGVLEEDA
jgi:hypothetical protein